MKAYQTVSGRDVGKPRTLVRRYSLSLPFLTLSRNSKKVNWILTQILPYNQN